MKKLLLVAACVALVGCDYTVQLAKTPEMDTDPKTVGLWERTQSDGQTERLLVLPLNTREYLVSFPLGSPDALFAKACLCRCAGRTLVQLEWIGTAKGNVADDARVFQFAAYTVTADTLEVRLLNPEVTGKDPASTADLAKAIETNSDKPDLFREPMIFKKAAK